MELVRFTPQTTVKNVPDMKALKPNMALRGHYDTVGEDRVARRAALAKFAMSAAEKATTEGVEVKLEPMSSADRKVVHMGLMRKTMVSSAEANSARSAEPSKYLASCKWLGFAFSG